MEMNKLEKRVIELRVSDDPEDRTIKGTAIVFNSYSELLGGQFREVINPEAVTPELISGSDIVMLYNHNDDFIPLARSKFGKGTLKITIEENGVDFNFKAKRTQLGDEVLEAVRNGDLDSCSFAFVIDEGGDDWEKRDDGSYIRTINRFKSLHDFSIVVNPAYRATEVNTRGLDDLKQIEELDKQKEIEKQKEEEQRIVEFYKEYDKIISDLKS